MVYLPATGGVRAVTEARRSMQGREVRGHLPTFKKPRVPRPGQNQASGIEDALIKGQERNLGRVSGTQILGQGSRLKPLSLKKELEKQSKTVALQTKIFQQIIKIKKQEQNCRLQNGRKSLPVLHQLIPYTTRHIRQTVQ